MAAEAGAVEGPVRSPGYRARRHLLAHLRMHAATAQLSRSSDTELGQLFARDPEFVLDAYAQNRVLSVRFPDAEDVAARLRSLLRPLVGDGGLALIDTSADIGRRSVADAVARPAVGAERTISALREAGRGLSAARSSR